MINDKENLINLTYRAIIIDEKKNILIFYGDTPTILLYDEAYEELHIN